MNYQDQKYTVWERTHFTIETRSREEAMAQAASMIRDNIYDTVEQNIRVGNAEILYDTFEDLSVEENGGNATREIYMAVPHMDMLLADDADKQ